MTLLAACAATTFVLTAGCMNGGDDKPVTDGTRGRPVSEPPHKADPQMQAVLDALASLNGKPIETLSPEEARKQPTATDAVVKLLTEKNMPTVPKDGVMITPRMIPGAAGQIQARVYTPAGEKKNRPLIVYYRGGGWVIATLDTYEPSCRALAAMTDAIVISVNYRQAPEATFPAAHEDAYAALQWAFANAAQMGADPTKIAVVGESAGGNLADAVCLMARDRGGKMPIHQVLIYPVADTQPGKPSMMEYAQAKPLNAAMLPWFLKYYAPKDSDKLNPNLALLKADGDLAKLPAATIITAEIDPLRSEGEMLAAKLKAGGVDVAYENFDGVTHEFFGMGAVVEQAKKAEMLAAARLKTAFAMKKT